MVRIELVCCRLLSVAANVELDALATVRAETVAATEDAAVAAIAASSAAAGVAAAAACSSSKQVDYQSFEAY